MELQNLNRDQLEQLVRTMSSSALDLAQQLRFSNNFAPVECSEGYRQAEARALQLYELPYRKEA